MNWDVPPSQISSAEPTGSDRLDSWKEIAAYLKRDVRTVHRWEAEEGLPVRRHLHKKRGTVYAYKAELEEWWNARQPQIQQEESAAPVVRQHFGPARIVTLTLAVALLVAVAGYLTRCPASPPRPPLTGRLTLVVLPFENPGNDPEQQYFSDGLTEEMITELGKLQPERLGVIARASAMRYKGSGKGIQQIARELGVDYVLESSVRRSDNTVRITARLVQARDQTQLWAQSYERELQDMLEVQSEVARAISKEISLQLSPEQQLRLAAARQVDPEAHEAYLKGLYFFGKFTPSGMQKSVEFLQEAIRKQPDHAKAYARMARAYGLLGNFGTLPPEDAYPRQKGAAQKALELDAALDEARSALGWSKLFYDRDWAGARDEFRRATELSPNSATAHQGLATYFVSQGQFDQALAEILQAQRLDPINLSIKADVGWYLFYARRTDESIAHLQKVLEMDANFSIARLFLAFAFEQKKMFGPAIVEHKEALRLFDHTASRMALLGSAYALAGREREARQVLAKLKALPRGQYVSPYNTALIYVGLADHDAAFRWLEMAYRDHAWMMVFLKVDPRLDRLRSDSRFTDLLRRMRLAS